MSKVPRRAVPSMIANRFHAWGVPGPGVLSDVDTIKRT